jgi:hypothetical protein
MPDMIIDDLERQVMAQYLSIVVEREGLVAAGKAGEGAGILLHLPKLSLTPDRFAATIGIKLS